jgi:hypothetical protein
LGQPLNATTSPAVVFGSPFKHASLVNATCDSSGYHLHSPFTLIFSLDIYSEQMVAGGSLGFYYLAWQNKKINFFN